MLNPRFPHTLRVWRISKDNHGEPVTNDDGDPIYNIVTLRSAVLSDEMPIVQPDGCFETHMSEWVHFGYRNQTTKDSTDVIVSDYKLATPPLFTQIKPGDRVEIRDYTRSYWGEVVKMMPFNLGSNIWVNEIRN